MIFCSKCSGKVGFTYVSTEQCVVLIHFPNLYLSCFRTFYNACKQSTSSNASKANEVVKSANLLFSTLEPSYIWIHCGHLFEKACSTRAKTQVAIEDITVRPVGSEMPNLVEVCVLTEFLLENVSLDAFIDTPSEHLPGLFHEITSKLLHHINILSPMEISKSLKLCAKILSKMQPTMMTTHTDKYEVDMSLNNITIPSDHSLAAIPLEKSQSDSKLNKPDAASTSFTEKSPSTRRRANSGGATKRNEKKSKKKGSKSTPKLNDSYTIQADSSNISVVVSEDSKALPRNKSMDDIKASCIETDDLSPTSKSQLSTLKLFANTSPNGSTGSLCKGPSPAFQAQHSMLEKCLRQYEIFYVKLIGQRILSRERTVQDMFEQLVVSCPRKSFDERMRYLEHLLNSKLNVEDSGFFSHDTSVTEDTKCLDIFHLSLDIAAHSDWTEAMKIASTLFVELSAFPKYRQPGDDVHVEEEPKFEQILPDWLKVLIVCSCWLQKQPALQLTSIATLLDLISLLEAHNDVETHPKSGEGMTAVIMAPLLKQWHVTYLMQYTNIFQVCDSSHVFLRILIIKNTHAEKEIPLHEDISAFLVASLGRASRSQVQDALRGAAARPAPHLVQFLRRGRGSDRIRANLGKP